MCIFPSMLSPERILYCRKYEYSCRINTFPMKYPEVSVNALTLGEMPQSIICISFRHFGSQEKCSVCS